MQITDYNLSGRFFKGSRPLSQGFLVTSSHIRKASECKRKVTRRHFNFHSTKLHVTVSNQKELNIFGHFLVCSFAFDAFPTFSNVRGSRNIVR